MLQAKEARRRAVEQLARQLRHLERRGETPLGGASSYQAAAEGTSGTSPLDALLPLRGEAGLLVEWLSEEEGSGAATLLLLSARRWLAGGGNLVVVDPRREFYPPAAIRFGVSLERTVLVHPAGERDTLWAVEQALRCGDVAATICRLEQIGDRNFRRFQLAAERGGGVGMLWRSARYRAQPSWADVRFHVRSLQGSGGGRRFRLERLRCRGERGRRTVELELNDETGVVRLAAQLAPATFVARAAGA